MLPDSNNCCTTHTHTLTAIALRCISLRFTRRTCGGDGAAGGIDCAPSNAHTRTTCFCDRQNARKCCKVFNLSPLSLSPTVQNNDAHRLETAQNRVCNDVRAFSASLKRLQNLAWPRNAITADGARVSERASERVRRIGERIVEQCNSIMHAVDEEKC